LRADGSRRLLTAPAVVAMSCMLTGCLAQSQIQSKYMDSQEDCRNETARSVNGGETARPVSESQTSPIAQRFSDCMTKEGWHLSTPKPGAAVAAATPPVAPVTGSTFPRTVTGQPASSYPPQSSYPANPSTYNTNTYYYGKPASSYPPQSSYQAAPTAAVAATAPVAATAAVAPAARPATAAYAAPRTAPAAANVARAPVAGAAPVAATAATAAVAPTAASAATTAGTKAATSAIPPQTSIPTSPDVATYQPGRPSGEAAPYYGTGPGRQF
jgi:hypothetical protein